jgi:hypothetical protein
MLKAIQILGCCSSGFVWKPRSSGGLSFISVSAKPLSYSSSKATRMDSSFLPEFSVRRARSLRAFRASSARSESNPDGRSASSSSVAVQSSAVSFSGSSFLSI